MFVSEMILLERGDEKKVVSFSLAQDWNKQVFCFGLSQKGEIGHGVSKGHE